MAKQGMKRPNISRTEQKNEFPPVPELQGKAKHSKKPARPIIAGTEAPSQKGLSIARAIVQTHKGKINASTRDGHSVLITVTLPR